MRDQRSSDERDLNDFAAQLGALAPRSALDRDRLMFAAGRRSGLRTMRGWLATISVAWFGVVAALVMSPSHFEPRLVDTPRPAMEHSANLARPNDDAEHSRNSSPSRHAPEGSSNFRVLRGLLANAESDLRMPAQTALNPDAQPSSRAPSYRELLRHSLEDSNEPL